MTALTFVELGGLSLVGVAIGALGQYLVARTKTAADTTSKTLTTTVQIVPTLLKRIETLENIVKVQGDEHHQVEETMRSVSDGHIGELLSLRSRVAALSQRVDDLERENRRLREAVSVQAELNVGRTLCARCPLKTNDGEEL